MEVNITYLILGMALVTYLPRALPLFLFARIDLPPTLLRWLAYVPAAVLAALLAPAIFRPEGFWDFSIDNLFLLAAIPTFFVAIITRSMIWSIVAGMLVFAGLQILI
jgi:branched-subunit amino acid transport protein